MYEQERYVNEWVKMVARARMGKTVKSIAWALARYADWGTGENACPGNARLAVECEMSYTKVGGALAFLRDAGLIEKTGRRYDADIYRLTLPDAAVFPVPNPAEHELAIQRLRDKERGSYKGPGPKRSTLPPVKPGAEIQDGPSAPGLTGGRVDQSAPAFQGGTAESAPSFEPVCPPSNEGLPIDPPVVTFHSERNLGSNVSVPSDPDRDGNDSQNGDGEGDPRELAEIVSINVRGTCPHGNSTRRNRHGQLRCEECREEPAEPVVTIPTAEAIAVGAQTVHLLPATCADHGMPTGKCLFCRRQLPGRTGQ